MPLFGKTQKKHPEDLPSTVPYTCPATPIQTVIITHIPSLQTIGLRPRQHGEWSHVTHIDWTCML